MTSGWKVTEVVDPFLRHCAILYYYEGRSEGNIIVQLLRGIGHDRIGGRCNVSAHLNIIA
jgi:hypothetical protein